MGLDGFGFDSQFHELLFALGMSLGLPEPQSPQVKNKFSPTHLTGPGGWFVHTLKVEPCAWQAGGRTMALHCFLLRAGISEPHFRGSSRGWGGLRETKGPVLWGPSCRVLGGSVWLCLSRLCPGRTHPLLVPSPRSKAGWIKQTPAPCQPCAWHTVGAQDLLLEGLSICRCCRGRGS